MAAELGQIRFESEIRSKLSGMDLTDQQINSIARIYGDEVETLVEWCVELLSDADD